MKKIVLLLMVIFLCAGFTHAQRILIDENFESTAGMTADSLPAQWAKFKVLTPGLCTWAVWGIRDSGQVMCGTNNLCGYLTKSHPPGKRALNIPWTANSGTQTDDWVFTKSVSLLANDSLLFWMQLGSYPCGGVTYYWDSCQIWISTNQNPVGGTKTKLGTVISLPAATNLWQNIKYNLSAFAGQTVYIGFRYYMYTGVDGIMVNLDDVFVGNRSAGGTTMVNPTNMCAYTSASVWSNFWGHGSDNFGDTLYVAGGGAAGSGSTTVYRYNIHSNTMGTNGVPIPESKSGHSFTRCGSSLYLIGGSTAVSTGGTTCYKYTPSTGTWTSIAPLPVALSGHNAVNWGDSVIFVVGGPWATPSTSVYAYRPASNTWITSTSLPAGTGRRSAACGLTNGKIYLSCGYSGAFRNDLVIGTIGANATTITWATGPVVPFLGGKTGTSRPGGTAVNGKFYLITGEVTPAPTTHDTIYVFDGATNTWSNIKGGRGGQAASNYWSAISYKVMSSGAIKIFIPGGSITGGIGQLCCLQVPACTITGVENNSPVPTTYSLSQNYPNPFNPVTKISFDIPKSGFVSLKIYDILGKEIQSLVNEVKEPGSYIVDFNGVSFASGTYFYRLESNGFVSTKKMLLVK